MTEKNYTLDDMKQLVLKETIKTHRYAKETNATTLMGDDVELEYFSYAGSCALSHLADLAYEREDWDTVKAICKAQELFDLVAFNHDEILTYLKENLHKEG